MLLSNLKKWSKVVPTVSNLITNGTTNTLPKALTSFTFQLESSSVQLRSLYFTRSENFNIFKRIQKGPSLSHKGKSKWNSLKRRSKHRAIEYKLPNHNGMVARVKIVGPRWARRFKFVSGSKRHNMRKMSSNNLRRKMRKRYICKADLRKVKRLIPQWKKQKFKRAH